MSVPNSMRVGPFCASVLVKKKYLIIYIFLIWITLLPAILEMWWYWQMLWHEIRPIHFYIFLPLYLFVIYVSIVFFAVVFTKILLSIISVFHKPREGVFLRDPSDKDYRYWSLRNTLKKWPTWLAHKFPFPFLDNICFMILGVKTKFSNSLFEGWVDTEFMEFGKNVVIGQGAIVQSSVIIGNLLIIKKTIIEENVRIGAHVIIMPGTHIRRDCILNTWSSTMVGQELEEGWIYNGGPAKKFKKNRFFEEIPIEKLTKAIGNMDELIKKYDETRVARVTKKRRLLHRKEKEEDTTEEEEQK
ncbi:MAG: DapH/DapD/GlmU-related protein [Promethearchaeota archaeon]